MAFGRKGLAQAPKPQGEKRDAHRRPVALPALVQTVAGRKQVSLINLSRKGAQLGGSDLPQPSQDILLKVASVDALGRVIWSKAGRCGVHFDRPISDEDVQRLQAAGQGVVESGMSLDEKRAADDWANGLIG